MLLVISHITILPNEHTKQRHKILNDNVGIIICLQYPVNLNYVLKYIFNIIVSNVNIQCYENVKKQTYFVMKMFIGIFESKLCFTPQQVPGFLDFQGSIINGMCSTGK